MLLLLTSASGLAQTQKPGSVQGNVTTAQDKTAVGLSGITVKLATEPPDGNAQSATSDEAGHYQFDNLKPGTYTVSAEQLGFKPFVKQVLVKPGQPAEVDVPLEIETVAQSIEVKEDTQAIVPDAVTAPTETVTQNQIVTLPTAQQHVREVLPVTPGVVRTQDGKLTFKGADENQSLMIVNSARTGDPVTGTFNVPVPTDAVQSFAVYKTPYDASLGSFTGGLTALETRPPDGEWNYHIRNIVPSVLGKNGSMVGLAEANPALSVSGPLLQGKLLFSEVFQYEMKKRTVRGLPWPNDISKKQGFNSFTTLEAILSEHQVLTVTLNAFPLREQHADINALVPQPASNDLNQKGISLGVSDKYQRESGGIFGILAQYTRFDGNAHGQGPEDMLITPEGWGGNFFNQWSRRGKELQIIPSYQTKEKHWFGGRHQIKFGTDIDYRSYFGSTASHPIQLLRQDGTLAETIDFQASPFQDASDLAVTEFAQDHWVISSHWAADFGARLSHESRGWGAALAPRMGLAYSPGKENKIVIRAGIGLFYSLLPMLAADFSANPAREITLFDGNSLPLGPTVSYPYAFFGAQNPLAANLQPTRPDTSPRNVTWNLGVERELRHNILGRINYLDSHATYLYVANPVTTAAQSYIGLFSNGASHYRELETTVHFTVGDKNEGNVSYIWSRTRGDLNNLSAVLIPFAQPVIRPNVYGKLPSDLPQRVVAWGIVSLPKGFKFSPLADIHSGYAYSDVDVLQNYVGTPNGQRFATYFSLDVKVYRDFRMPFLGSPNKKHHIRLGFYALNVTNHGNFNAVYNNVTAPNFGQFVGFLDRREGAVIDFID
ncbi:MAG TPA: carboxypeptidase regulatory-like domain-containing protein [Dongiaceae bacterium]|nr:carboxypeptidase regulatory-like domain-containing protein [Dongiaceae bacterium]